ERSTGTVPTAIAGRSPASWADWPARASRSAISCLITRGIYQGEGQPPPDNTLLGHPLEGAVDRARRPVLVEGTEDGRPGRVAGWPGWTSRAWAWRSRWAPTASAIRRDSPPWHEYSWSR